MRVGYDTINRIQISEHIRLVTHTGSFEVRVNDIRHYGMFEEMLNAEPWERIVPDSKSKEEVLSLLKQIYPKNKENLGVIVLEFVKIGKSS